MLQSGTRFQAVQIDYSTEKKLFHGKTTLEFMLELFAYHDILLPCRQSDTREARSGIMHTPTQTTWKLLSWNVNGFRAVSAKGAWDWFYSSNADIVGIQETKVDQDQLPENLHSPEGYYSSWASSQKKKGYSGVATFSKTAPLAVTVELPEPAFQNEGRLIHLEMPDFHFLNVYFPNGQKDDERLSYKLGYYDAFLQFSEELRQTKPIVVCGDFNTAHKPIDLARPQANQETSGFLPIERAWLDAFIAHGYIDTFRYIHGDDTDQYSWWSYRFKARERNVGWRIDYFFVSEELAPCIKNAWLEPAVTGSDHCPIGLELALPGL